MGPYCAFCGFRCFLTRVVPDGPRMGWSGLMATCARGMALDREQTGHDHTTAINPVTDQDGAERVARVVALRRGWFHVTWANDDAPDGTIREWSDFGPGLWERRGSRWEPADARARAAVETAQRRVPA